MDYFDRLSRDIKNCEPTLNELRICIYLKRVSNRHLKAYYMSAFEGLTDNEIAEIFGVSRTRVYQMKQKVKIVVIKYIRNKKSKYSKADISNRRERKNERDLFDIQYSKELHDIARNLSVATCR